MEKVSCYERFVAELSFVATCKNEVSNKKEKISSSQCKRKELISFTF